MTAIYKFCKRRIICSTIFAKKMSKCLYVIDVHMSNAKKCPYSFNYFNLSIIIY